MPKLPDVKQVDIEKLQQVMRNVYQSVPNSGKFKSEFSDPLMNNQNVYNIYFDVRNPKGSGKPNETYILVKGWVDDEGVYGFQVYPEHINHDAYFSEYCKRAGYPNMFRVMGEGSYLVEKMPSRYSGDIGKMTDWLEDKVRIARDIVFGYVRDYPSMADWVQGY